jgi:hypothetical protein
MISPLILAPLITALCLLRVAYIRTKPVQKDVRDAFVSCSRRLHLRDYFRPPISFEVKDAFWGMPYGVIWHAINVPLMHLAQFDGKRWVYIIGLIDGVFIWVSFLLGPIGGLLYIAISTFQLVRGPWNVSILWITVLGVFSWIFLLLAPIAKLPVGIPVPNPRRIGRLITHQHNSLYYGLLGVLWLFVLWRTLLPQLFASTIIGQVVTWGL